MISKIKVPQPTPEGGQLKQCTLFYGYTGMEPKKFDGWVTDYDPVQDIIFTWNVGVKIIHEDT